ncbi:CopD family protein [Orrella sp. JC864]|uniref:CopD family protein n=1 Tax=Orrella sp. JC864 TaxID=3120298 RepID=UPI003009F109
MAWLKALHIATLVIWSAGLFYLPGLFASLRHVRGRRETLRLHVMTRMTFVVIASPAAVLAIISGTALVAMTGVTGEWLALKLTAVGAMVLFHLYCGHLVERLDNEPRLKRVRLRLTLLVVPAVLVPLVVWLVMAKPAFGLLAARGA